MTRLPSIAFMIALMAGAHLAMAQASAQVPPAPQRPARPGPPTRDPHTPGCYVRAR